MATKITLNELRSIVKQIIKEEQSKLYSKLGSELWSKLYKGQILTLATTRGDNNGEVTIDTVNNSMIIGYMKSQSTTPIKVKIIQSKNGEGYDVYMEDGTMIRNNHKIGLNKRY
jgi:hypothetical protein